MGFRELKIPVTTTGSAGSATGTGTSDFPQFGLVLSVKLDYHASAPATTDVLVAEKNGFGRTILDVDDNATDGIYQPRIPAHTTAGVEGAATELIYLMNDFITVTVEGCDALTNAVVVTVLLVD